MTSTNRAFEETFTTAEIRALCTLVGLPAPDLIGAGEPKPEYPADVAAEIVRGLTAHGWVRSNGDGELTIDSLLKKCLTLLCTGPLRLAVVSEVGGMATFASGAGTRSEFVVQQPLQIGAHTLRMAPGSTLETIVAAMVRPNLRARPGGLCISGQALLDSSSLLGDSDPGRAIAALVRAGASQSAADIFVSAMKSKRSSTIAEISAHSGDRYFRGQVTWLDNGANGLWLTPHLNYDDLDALIEIEPVGSERLLAELSVLVDRASALLVAA